MKARWTDVIPRALQFVTEQGRMKFVRPIYRSALTFHELWKSIGLKLYFYNVIHFIFGSPWEYYVGGLLSMQIKCCVISLIAIYRNGGVRQSDVVLFL